MTDDDTPLLKQTLKITAVLLGISVLWVGGVTLVSVLAVRAAVPAATTPATPAGNPASSPPSTPPRSEPRDTDNPQKRRTG